MQVPKALTDRREQLECQTDAAIEKRKEAQATEDRLYAELKGVRDSIAIVAGAEASLLDMPVSQSVPVTPPELRVPSTSSTLSSPAPERRNTRKMIVELLQAGATQGLSVILSSAEIAKKLDLPKAQVEKALIRLENEDAVLRDGSRWRALIPAAPMERPPLPPYWVEEAKLSGVPIGSDNPGDADQVDIPAYLAANPEGRTPNELVAAGYTMDQVRVALAKGAIWDDARGYYHASIKAAPVDEQEAAE